MTNMEIKNVSKLKARNTVVPIVILILVSFFGLWYNGALYIEEGASTFTLEGIRDSFCNGDASVVLIWGAIVASITAMIMGISQKTLNLGEAFDAFVDGSKSLLITCIILVLAWSLGSITEQVGTADFLVGVVSDSVPGGILPIMIFLISCVVAFSTGTSWGTMAIVIPLALPLASSYVTRDLSNAPLIISTISAVLSGSVFGNHCSPISDTTIMSSMASAADHIDHVKTQTPYAILGASLAMIGYLLVGTLNFHPLIVLVLDIASIIAFVHFFGKSTLKKI